MYKKKQEHNGSLCVCVSVYVGVCVCTCTMTNYSKEKLWEVNYNTFKYCTHNIQKHQECSFCLHLHSKYDTIVNNFHTQSTADYQSRT